MIFRNWVMQNFPFLEDDFDALTDYELFCKMVEYMKESLKTIQDFQQEINLFSAKLDEFQHYFDNLDVTEEVNAKLDEMADDGTLENLIGQYLELMTTYAYNNVAEMQEATNLVNGSFAKTYGFYSYNDGGASFYKVRHITNEDTVDNITIIALDDESLVAELMLTEEMNVEQFGAKGDDTADDYDSFVLALSLCDKVKLSNKTYKLDTQLRIDSQKELSGKVDIIGYSKLDAVNGVKLAGQKITFKNIELIGDSQQNYGIYSCGNDEGSAGSGANSHNQIIIKNVIISNYNYGIYFNGVVWNNRYDNIRINFCNYGMYATTTYYIMTTLFTNIYFSGCINYDVQMSKTKAKFDTCNFGISSNHIIQFTQNCNVIIENSNIECDKYISGTGILIEISGKNLILRNNCFKMSTASTIELFSTGAAVQNLTLENNTYESVTFGGNSNAMVNIFSSQITGPKYGIININSGNNDFPINIENANRLAYGKYPYVRWHNIIQAYSSLDDLSKLNKGDMVYFYETNKIKYYNGTSMVEM